MNGTVTLIAAVASPIATLVGIYIGVQAYRAKKISDDRAAKVAEIQLGMDSLKAALSRSDDERRQLAADRDDFRNRLVIEEERTRVLGAEVREVRADLKQHAEHIAILKAQVVQLGGTPIPGGT